MNDWRPTAATWNERPPIPADLVAAPANGSSLTALLFAVEKSDFLYLQHETEMNKGTLSSHSR